MNPPLIPALLLIAFPAFGQPEPTHEFTIPPERQQLFGISFSEVRSARLVRTIRAVGTVAPRADRHWDYVARVDGYIHDLKALSPGQVVRKGEELLDLYSPDLVATEQEYVDVLRMRDTARASGDDEAARTAESLLASAKYRLEQWNVTDAQIQILATAKTPRATLPLRAPFDATVETVLVHQGRHVSVGDHLVDLVELSSVWVWANFYENELPSLHPGLTVTVFSPSNPAFRATGRIAVIDPFVDEQSRTGRARIDLDNPGLALRPGAFVNVTATVDDGTGLVIPAGAVLPTGSRNVVFVDRGGGRLEPRRVTLGGEYGDSYAVASGLEPGDRVVTSGNFLVDAESKVQGAGP